MFKPWDDFEEKSLEIYKEKVSGDCSKVTEISDVRMISQILLDYLDHLKGPIISPDTIEKLEILVEKQRRGEDLDRIEILKEVRKGKDRLKLTLMSSHY